MSAALRGPEYPQGNVGQSSHFISGDIRCVGAYLFAPVLRVAYLRPFLALRIRLSTFPDPARSRIRKVFLVLT